MLATNVLGLPIPDAGRVFVVALVLHVAAGLTCVVAGALAASARKRPGRHPRSGRVYLWGLAFVFATATVMATIRWHEDAHLFGIAVVAASLGAIGWSARRRRWRGWVRWHASGMGGSYIALLTGFYVDNGPNLPLWRLLPHWSYWVIPLLVGTPLIVSALHRYATGVSSRPPEASQGGGGRPRQGTSEVR